jgi:putative tricarboxylic transport membrane protein
MDPLINGFVASISFVNLLTCFLGVLIGTIVGVLPGLGPAATMAITLPFTLKYGAATGLIMLSGIWFGAMYGGSTTSILVNLPGEAASVVTCMDGYPMAKKGRAGAALAMVAIGSFVAGTLGIIGLQVFAPLLGNVALSFGPPEYFAFMIFALVLLSNLGTESSRKGLLMLGLGLWISSIGLSALDGAARFTFGISALEMGIDFLPVAMGFFGIAEILRIAVEKYIPPIVMKLGLRELYPNKAELKRSVFPIFRGSVIGFFVGLLPGPCSVVSTFISYSLEKRLSLTPEEFGKGMIEGVVGPESANNSAVMGAMIPLLTLGIPFNAPSAILLAGLRMHNIEPGPLLFQQTPAVFWTFIAAMYIGNFILLILNLPLVGFFARVATLKPKFLIPIIMVLCLVGIYAVRNSFFDIWVMIACGVMGFFFVKRNYPIAPFVIGIILGPMTESNFRKSLMMFNGNLALIYERPIAMTILGLSLAFIGYKVALYFLHRRFVLNGTSNV